MNNSFKDSATGLAFFIPFSRQLSSEEASNLFSLWIEQEKIAQFESWKSKKENSDWEGDSIAKAEELFTQYCSRQGSSPILLGLHSTPDQ